MRTFLPCLGLLVQVPLLPAMEVHEWGTFTTYSSTDGTPVAWYQPFEDLAKLPPFVASAPLFTKSGLATVRMETPVLYFYPEKPGAVEVSVTFRNGRVTESYPPSTRTDGRVTWSGNLIPPDDSRALGEIPEVTGGDPLEPYGAARQVPAAWIYRQPGKEPNSHPDTEKFIFYRGSGDTALEMMISAPSSDALQVSTIGSDRFPRNLALRVRDGKAVWIPLPAVDRATPVRIDWPADLKPVAKAEAEMIPWFRETLTDAGLTTDEADAMIATWRAVWLREEGDRVFALLPRRWVDRTLPLQIEPRPECLTRVFIARLEVLPTEKESQLLALLDDSPDPAGDDSKSLQELQLGRFSRGALEAAILSRESAMRRRFSALQERSIRRTTGIIR